MIHFFKFIGQLIIAILAAVIFIFLFVHAERVWAPGGLVLAILFYGPITLNLLLFPLRPRLWQKSYYRSTADLGHGGAFAAFLIHFICFSFISRGIWMFAGPHHFTTQFGYPELDSWLLYGLDNVVRAIVFDVAEVYGISVSGIEHATTVPMSTFVFTYRLSLSLGMLSILIDYVKKNIQPTQPLKDGSARV